MRKAAGGGREGKGGGPKALLLVAALVLVAARLPALVEPLGMDQSLYVLIARELLQGKTLYTEIYDHKPPGFIYLYVPLSLLCGARGWAFALLDLVLALAQLVLVHRILFRSLGGRAAAWGAGLFVFLLVCPVWGGKIAFCQGEVFVNLLLLAVFAYASAAPRPGRRASFVLGLVAAALFLVKYVPVLLLVPALALTRAPEPGERLRQVGWGFVGFLAGTLPVAIHLAVTGAGAAYVETVLSFGPLYAAARVNDLLPSLTEKLFAFALPLVLGLYGLAAGGKDGRRGRLAAAAWLAGAVAMLLVQRKYFYYHFLVLVPPLALLGGAGARAVERMVARRGEGSRARWRLGLVIVLLFQGLVLAVRFYWANENVFRYRVLADRPLDFAEATAVSYGYRLLPTRILAERIRAWSKPGDELFVWGMNPLLYLEADRRPFWPTVSHQFLLTDEALSRSYGDHVARRRRFLAEFRERPPACFVCARQDRSVFDEQDSWEQLRRFPELLALLRRDFVLALRVRNAFLWVRRDRAPKTS